MPIREKLRSAFQRTVIAALTTVERVQTGASFNPLDRRFRTDPYPLYRRLRERDPFHRSRLQPAWVLSRYADVATVLQNGQRFLTDGRKLPRYVEERARAIKQAALDPDEPDVGGAMLTADPPDHTRLRSLVSRAFTPRTVETLRPRIEAFVEETLDVASKQGRMDIVRDLAYPLPVTVIAEMLGIPSADRARFKHWSDELIRTIGFSSNEDMRRANRAQKELRAYMEPIIEERRRAPQEDLISGLAAAEEQGDRLSVDEMYATINLLLVAGNETTTNLIGNGMLALLRNPDQLERLRSDESIVDNAVEEMLRYDSPVQMTSRWVAEDTEINGHAVKKFDELFLLLGSANRDPGQFAEPDRLYLARQDVRHLSFSHGIHFCLGAPLARIEGQVALTALARRFPEMRLVSDRVEWGDNLILRGPTSLPVQF